MGIYGLFLIMGNAGFISSTVSCLGFGVRDGRMSLIHKTHELFGPNSDLSVNQADPPVLGAGLADCGARRRVSTLTTKQHLTTL